MVPKNHRGVPVPTATVARATDDRNPYFPAGMLELYSGRPGEVTRNTLNLRAGRDGATANKLTPGFSRATNITIQSATACSLYFRGE